MDLRRRRRCRDARRGRLRRLRLPAVGRGAREHAGAGARRVPTPRASTRSTARTPTASGSCTPWMCSTTTRATSSMGWTLTVNTGPVDAAIPGSGSAGAASPYPLSVTLPSQQRVITDLEVHIDGIWHQRPDDLDLLLVGPRGQRTVLMSDACGSFGVAAFGWRWDDEAAAPMPDGDSTNLCGTTSHRPTDYEPGDVWPAPAPAGPYADTLSVFDGSDPSGEWRLYVNDDSFGAGGFFTNRFQVVAETRAKAEVAFAEARVAIAEGETRELTHPPQRRGQPWHRHRRGHERAGHGDFGIRLRARADDGPLRPRGHREDGPGDRPSRWRQGARRGVRRHARRRERRRPRRAGREHDGHDPLAAEPGGGPRAGRRSGRRRTDREAGAALRRQEGHDRRHVAPRRAARHAPRRRDRLARRQRPRQGRARQRHGLRRLRQGRRARSGGQRPALGGAGSDRLVGGAGRDACPALSRRDRASCER